MKICRRCGTMLRDDTVLCPACSYSKAEHDRSKGTSDDNFGLSFGVAMATDSALLGFAVGGSIVGAILSDSYSSDSYSDSGSSGSDW